MRPTPRPFHRSALRRQRGSAMVLVVIILAVLAMLGAAALRLAQQEAVNVSRRIDYQVLASCAEAAQKRVWADIAKYGTNASPLLKPTIIPGANTRLVIGHFDNDITDVTSVTFADGLTPVPKDAMSGGIDDNNLTNTIATSRGGGSPYMLTAHCTDKRGRQYEVELLVKFGL